MATFNDAEQLFLRNLVWIVFLHLSVEQIMFYYHRYWLPLSVHQETMVYIYRNLQSTGKYQFQTHHVLLNDSP